MTGALIHFIASIPISFFLQIVFITKAFCFVVFIATVYSAVFFRLYILVQGAVFCQSHDLKILNSIVVFNAVNMMNNIISSEFSFKVIGHYNSMLKIVTIFHANKNISLWNKVLIPYFSPSWSFLAKPISARVFFMGFTHLLKAFKTMFLSHHGGNSSFICNRVSNSCLERSLFAKIRLSYFFNSLFGMFIANWSAHKFSTFLNYNNTSGITSQGA